MNASSVLNSKSTSMQQNRNVRTATSEREKKYEMWRYLS